MFSSLISLDYGYSDRPATTKVVKFSYIPKKFNSLDSFYWLIVSGKSVLCTIQSNSFYFWNFLCVFSSIQATIISELNFQDSNSLIENFESCNHLFLFNRPEETFYNVEVMV